MTTSTALTRAPEDRLSYFTRLSLLIGVAVLMTGILVFSLGSLCPLWVVWPNGVVWECRG